MIIRENPIKIKFSIKINHTHTNVIGKKNTCVPTSWSRLKITEKKNKQNKAKACLFDCLENHLCENQDLKQ